MNLSKHKMMQAFSLAYLIAIFFIPLSSLATNCHRYCQCRCYEDLYNQHPWSLMYFHGKTMSDGLIRIVGFHLTNTPEQAQSIELAYTLDQANAFRRFLHPIVPVVQIAGNVTYRYRFNQPNIYEFDPYIILRWVNFAWNPYVNTSLAFAEGISYDTSIACIEKNNINAKRLLNYIMFEATLALPNHPRYQVLLRLHHRSGVYGLYGAGKKDGTNVLGLGVRYLFD